MFKNHHLSSIYKDLLLFAKVVLTTSACWPTVHQNFGTGDSNRFRTGKFLCLENDLKFIYIFHILAQYFSTFIFIQEEHMNKCLKES